MTFRRNTHLIKYSVVITPLPTDFDVQVEIDLGVEEPLQVLTRLSTDLFDHRATRTDDDRFLRRSLDQNRTVELESSRLTVLIELVHHHRSSKRQLRMSVTQNLLPNRLGRKHPLGLIG